MIFVGQVVGVLRDLQPPPPKVPDASYLIFTCENIQHAHPCVYTCLAHHMCSEVEMAVFNLLDVSPRAQCCVASAGTLLHDHSLMQWMNTATIQCIDGKIWSSAVICGG